jgi:hypothetical protein
MRRYFAMSPVARTSGIGDSRHIVTRVTDETSTPRD